MPSEMPKVYEGDRDYAFACYSHDDRDAVLPIINALVDEGYRTWYDDGIELAGNYPEHIAEHVRRCACFVMFVSNASLESDWCKDEVNYALNLHKSVLPVYLKDVELTPGLQMRMGHKQAIHWYEYDSDEAFYKQLFNAWLLNSCLTDEGRKRRGVKPRLTADDKGTQLATIESKRAVTTALESETIDPFVALAKCQAPKALTTQNMKIGQDIVANTPVKPRDGKRIGVKIVDRRGSLAEYSWTELKALSWAIAVAGSEAEGLGIAKAYSLVDKNGKLRGNRRHFKLKDGTHASVRILGFRHDDLEGGEKAGISFEFSGVLTRRRMNADSTNRGGWENSEMRRWLNTEFLARLPDDLSPLVEATLKRTNNIGEVDCENDTRVVTANLDKLWLLSMSEVYGRLVDQTDNVPWSPAIYDAEGVQYQLYVDKGVTTSSHGFCNKVGANSWWWLRSPSAHHSDGFHTVGGDGAWSLGCACYEDGVSPGFCL